MFSATRNAARTSPAPWNTMVWSDILLLVMRRAARSPATATAAVPTKNSDEFCLRMDMLELVLFVGS